jgi:AraC-like DNA-binding protein
MFEKAIFSILLFCVAVYSGDTLIFSSNFEAGQTYLLRTSSPGAASIVLVPSSSIHEWKINGGPGVIHGKMGEKPEIFSYNSLINNEIRGISDLKYKHSQWSSVKTGNFNSWDVTDPKISISTKKPINGSFSAKIPFDTTEAHTILFKSFKSVTEIWGRFNVRLSHEAIKDFKHEVAWFFELLTRLRIGLYHDKNKGLTGFVLRFHSGTGPGRGQKIDYYFYDKKPVAPDSVYLIEFHFVGGKKGGAEFWINGEQTGSLLDKNMEFFNEAKEISFGKFSWAYLSNGFMAVDDIVLAQKRAGPVFLARDSISVLDKLFATAESSLISVELKTPGTLESVPLYRPGEWTDLNISLGDTAALKNIKGLTLYIHRADLGPDADISAFHEKESYRFSFDPHNKNIFTTFKESFDKVYEVSNISFKYIDGKNTTFSTDRIRTRIRLSEKTAPGLWIINTNVSVGGVHSFNINPVPFIVASRALATQDFKLKNILPALMILAALLLIVLFIVRKKKSAALAGKQGEPREHPVVKKAVEYIEQNLENPEFSLQQVAAHVHLGRSSFSKLFNDNMGRSFPQYMNELRLERAKKYLLETNMQVSEIAFKTGFDSASVFNRTFKNIIGVTPGEFRRDKT